MTVHTPERQALDRRVLLIVSALAAAALMAVLDGSAVTASLGRMQASFDTSLATIVWATSIYLLSASLSLPLLGWASARFGGRQVLLAGMTIFVVGSLASGLAWSAGSLIAARAVQGFGGGLLEPAALALTAKIAPREQVGKVMGLLSLVINLGPVLGPIVGGLLSDAGLWRWIFLLNVPVGALVALAVVRFLDAGARGNATARADLRGMALLSPGFALTLLGMNRWGEGQGGWAAMSALTGVALLLGYAWHARRTPHPPVLDLRLLRVPAFSAALAVMAVVGVTMYSLLTVLPTYADREHGLSGLGRTSLVTALGLGLLLSMVNAGRISDRTGPRVLVRAGGVLAAASFATFAIAWASWPVPALAAVMVAAGIALGAVAAPSFASAFRSLPPERTDEATTALFVVVQLAASAGAAIVAVLLSRDQSYSTLFGLLSIAALAAVTMTRWLPGPPAHTE